MFDVFKIVFTILVVIFLLGLGRTWQLEKSPDQKLFEGGKLPKNLNGFYRGNASIGIKDKVQIDAEKAGWQGKEFEATSSTGVNIIKKDGVDSKKFVFKTYEGKGLRDKKLAVLKIDYSDSEPFYIRPIVDELIEIEKDKFLGKAQINLIPNFPITVTFFRLEKSH